MTKNLVNSITLLTGIGLIFIGARFLIAPEIAELGYGIRFNEGHDYSFHYIKGIRDLFAGLLICVLLAIRQTKALGVALTVAMIIPAVDMLIVLGKDNNGLTQAAPHIAAVAVCFSCGLFFLMDRKIRIEHNVGFTKIIRSEDSRQSIMEFNIVPNEKTPWHYHTLFSETMEIKEGTLEVGKNSQVYPLKKGDMVTIKPLEKHYFHNTSKDECLIEVTVGPKNKNFEHSLLILKGLARDRLATASGIPAKLTDLALFIYLNNSRMIGLQKVAEPLFHYVAKRAIKKGRLKELEQRYCGEYNTD